MNVFGQILIRKFLDAQPNDPSIRQVVLTTCLVLGIEESEELCDLVAQELDRSGPNDILLNEVWLRELLQLAAPEIKARLLWGFLGSCMSPELFREVFAGLANNSQELSIIYLISGAANDYLRRRPGSLQIPEQFNGLLRRSDNVDYRIIGVKLLKHSQKSTNEILTILAEFLGAEDFDEGVGALCELHLLLHFRGKSVIDSADKQVIRIVTEALQSFAKNFPVDDETWNDIQGSVINAISMLNWTESQKNG